MFVSYHCTGSIIAAVCQVEVVVTAIITGLIVHFVTKRAVKQKITQGQGRNGNTKKLCLVRRENMPIYDYVGRGASTGEDVELQPSPAYQTVPEYY